MEIPMNEKLFGSDGPDYDHAQCNDCLTFMKGPASSHIECRDCKGEDLFSVAMLSESELHDLLEEGWEPPADPEDAYNEGFRKYVFEEDS